MDQRRRKEKITACVLVALSIVYSFGCLGTKVGRIDNPGAGLIPWLIAVCLVIFTAINAFKVFKDDQKDNIISKEQPCSGRYTAVIGIACVILIYPVLLHYLKVIIATFITVFSILRFLRYKNAFSSLIVSLIVSVSVFSIFALLLGVTFPGGPLEEFLLRIRWMSGF
jgi:putative tricarboxylic transport membrane protein